MKNVKIIDDDHLFTIPLPEFFKRQRKIKNLILSVKSISNIPLEHLPLQRLCLLRIEDSYTFFCKLPVTLCSLIFITNTKPIYWLREKMDFTHVEELQTDTSDFSTHEWKLFKQTYPSLLVKTIKYKSPSNVPLFDEKRMPDLDDAPWIDDDKKFMYSRDQRIKFTISIRYQEECDISRDAKQFVVRHVIVKASETKEKSVEIIAYDMKNSFLYSVSFDFIQWMLKTMPLRSIFPRYKAVKSKRELQKLICVLEEELYDGAEIANIFENETVKSFLTMK